MGCDDFREGDFLAEDDLAETENKPDWLISAEEMRDMLCEEMHGINRGYLYSRLLEMGPVFRSSDYFSLLLYFNNGYMTS